MKIISWFSAGTTSAVACKLAIQKYGIENVDIYYIKINSAHSDNERFISDCQKWYQKEIKIVQSKKYDDQFEVIEDTGYVNGAGGARCTLELKKQVRFDIQKRTNADHQIFGFEFSLKEINRAVRFTEQYPDVKALYPLIEEKITKAECAEILLMNGIELPAMYKLGYNNNNCIGCVKGKKGYWNKIRKDFPDVFEKMAKAERIAGYSCIKTDIKQPDGTIKGKPLFLDELKPETGRKLKPIVPDCGSLCEIKFVDIISDKAKEIYKNKKLNP